MIGQPEPPGAVGSQAHPHPGAGRHRAGVAAGFQADRTLGDVHAEVGDGDTQGPAEIPGTAGQGRIGMMFTAAPAGQVHTVDHLTGAQQHRGCRTAGGHHDVRAVMTVNPVDVQPIGWAVHDRRPRGTSEGMRGRIIGSGVGLDLGEPKAHPVTDDPGAEQPARRLGRAR